MPRLPILTAFLAALAASPLAAQETQPPGQGPDLQASGGAQPVFSNMGTGHAGGAGHAGGFYEAADHMVLASRLMGQPVRHLDGRSEVGTVADLVLGGDGQFLAFVLDAGGRAVAVDAREITWMRFEEGAPSLAMNAAAGRLDAAPAFNLAAVTAAGAGRSGADPLNVAPPAPVANAEGELRDPTALGQPGAEADGARDIAAEPQTLDGFPVGRAAQPQTQQGTSTLQPGAEQAAVTDAARPQSQLTGDDLMGMRVFGAEGEEIGEVNDVIVDASGVVEAVVIDVGGFLGIGGHRVAVDFARTSFVEDAGMRAIQIAFTEDALRGQAQYDEEAYRRGDPGAALR
jgi:sporulation protein YlmC with PRC-barrel domain